jgi:hypothetical protein
MVKPGVHHLGAVSLEVGKAEIGKFETGARKRHRKPNLERTLLGAKKAGFNVARRRGRLWRGRSKPTEYGVSAC